MWHHSYHVTPQLSSDTTVIMWHHSYHVTPQLSSDTTVIMWHHSYQVTPQLSCDTTVIMWHHSYHMTPQLSCDTTVIKWHHSYHVTPQLSCDTTVYHVSKVHWNKRRVDKIALAVVWEMNKISVNFVNRTLWAVLDACFIKPEQRENFSKFTETFIVFHGRMSKRCW